MKLELLSLGSMDYASAYQLQVALLEQRIAEPDLHPDRLLLVEHDPVYTLGKYATDRDIVFADAQRKALGIDLVQTDRGGQVTYHGPGQITGYPIIRLSRKRGSGVAWYVNRLEEMLILTLRHFGLEGARDSINPGVWLGSDKVAAIGVRIRRQITMHGFALNVRAELSHYAGIVPCGIKERGVTSMHEHVPDIRVEDVKPILMDAFCEAFGYEGCKESSEVL